MEAFSLDCPNCGAPLDARPGDTAVTCSHCGSDIRITPDRTAVPFFHTGPAQGPAVDVAAVRRELDAGRKIDAVKLVREQTGLSLNEALNYVEALEQGAAPPPAALARTPPPPLTGELAEVQSLIAQGNKIAAIKRYRELNDTSLAEARAAVDALERGEPIPAFHSPKAQPRSPGTEAVRQRMAALPKSPMSGGGCGRIVLGIGLFILLILGGCGQYMRTTDLHACAVDLITSNNALREQLGSPITVSPLVLVVGYSSETDFGGNTDRSAGYFTIARGTRDSVWLYVEAYESSTGFFGVRYNPVPNRDDALFNFSGQIAACGGSG